MCDDTPCVIIECSESHQWDLRFAIGLTGPRQIPQDRRPVILQPNRQTAEREALRLAAARPGRQFVIFEAAAIGMTIKVPTHVNPAGKVLIEGSVPAILPISGDDGIPF